MKKFFNMKVIGYYPASALLGVLLTIIIHMIIGPLMIEADFATVFMNISSYYWVSFHMILASISIVTVICLIWMIDGNQTAWRSKFLQVVGFTGIFSLLFFIFNYAIFMGTWWILFCALFLMIPVLVLKKTKQN